MNEKTDGTENLPSSEDMTDNTDIENGNIQCNLHDEEAPNILPTHISRKQSRHMKRKNMEQSFGVEKGTTSLTVIEENEIVRLDEIRPEKKQKLRLSDEQTAKRRQPQQSEDKAGKKKKLKQDKMIAGILRPSKDDSKKLLILDVNKVLVSRNKGSQEYVPRPFVSDFLKQMSETFILAIWTSMRKNSSKKLISELFIDHGIPLLFVWYQAKCRTIPNTEIPDGKPLFCKDLEKVWKEFPSYNQENTVRKHLK
jgi:hypothetical protein